jgi:multidrug efflux pump subunit AcrB
MAAIIEFFLLRPRLNYFLLIFLFGAGIYSYKTMPKEIFPPIITDKISITGSYAGTSPETLDKMAVANIEDNINNISGIKKVESSIRSGQFSIILELADNEDKHDILSKVKDAISEAKRDFPSDMKEPSASFFKQNIPLILVNISSNKLSNDTLIEIAKEFKKKLATIKNLTDLTIYGEGTKEFRVVINSDKVKAFGLDPSAVSSAIAGLYSIFPIGKIEGNEHFFISTFNGAKDVETFLNTYIKIGDKRLLVKDVANITKQYAKSDTYSSFNGKNTITINVAKAKEGNSITLAKRVKSEVAALQKQFPDIEAGTFSDTSVYIRNRLNTVVSNIMFGLVLVGLVMYLLINKRISFVVVIGIPTSFVVSLVFLDYSGYSINMMTLLGALIAIGVIVDDAIIVAENIQRHIEEGMDKAQAAIVGTKEVIAPVLTASITTVFAFIPMLLVSGELGEFIKLIPIAISVLILASLIESFIFLPLHCKHALNPKEKPLSWQRANNIYKKIIARLIHHRWMMVIFFWIAVPLLTIGGFSQMNFKLFPTFDGDQMNISCKLPVGTTLEENFDIARELEEYIIKSIDKYYIDSVTTISGFRMDSKGEGEIGNNYFHIFIDLHKIVPGNFVAKYITPYFSFDYDGSGMTRLEKSYVIEEKMRKDLTQFMKKHKTDEFEVRGPNAGIVKLPIEIFIQSNDEEYTKETIVQLKSAMKKIDGVKWVGDDAKVGVSEIKLRVNSYGQRLGVTESYLSNMLEKYFLEASYSKAFDKDGLVEIVLEDSNKNSFETLKNFSLRLDNGSEVRLSDVADFIQIQNYEKLNKVGGQKRQTVFGDIDTTTTATLVLKELEPLIEKIKKDNRAKIVFGGEKEKNEQILEEFTLAALLALVLIFITLLVMFDSILISLIVLSIVPFSLLGVVFGHMIMGMGLTMPSIIGALGLAGVVINDGIIMLDFIKKTKSVEELLERAKLRLRPIILTSVTTLAGLSTLIFFPSGQAVILQPLAVSLGFGLFWGTVLNLLYLPALFALVSHTKEEKY